MVLPITTFIIYPGLIIMKRYFKNSNNKFSHLYEKIKKV